MSFWILLLNEVDLDSIEMSFSIDTVFLLSQGQIVSSYLSYLKAHYYDVNH